MYETPKYKTSTIVKNERMDGESIEMKVERIISNEGENKPGDGAPLIYTERKEGIRPEYNIRSDRFEIAIEATETVAKSYKARREEKAEMKIVPKEKDTDTGGESIQAK